MVLNGISLRSVHGVVQEKQNPYKRRTKAKKKKVDEIRDSVKMEVRDVIDDLNRQKTHITLPVSMLSLTRT